jgi:hypothetical protein
MNFNPTSGLVHLGEIFDVTIGRTACEACSAMWNLETNSAFALGPRKVLRLSLFNFEADEIENAVSFSSTTVVTMQDHWNLFNSRCIVTDVCKVLLMWEVPTYLYNTESAPKTYEITIVNLTSV